MKTEHLIKIAAALGECGYEITDIEGNWQESGMPISGYNINIRLVDFPYTGQKPALTAEALNG
jgi:hypothetical protein